MEKTLAKNIDRQRVIKKELKLDDLLEAQLKALTGRYHDCESALPIFREDYFDLVDTTGRCFRDDKRGYISPHTEKIILQLGIDPERWLEHVKSFSKRYGNRAGSKESIENFSAKFGMRWGKGSGVVARVYACYS